MIYVSWDDAKQYLAWLAKKTGKPYRLLSESEWEYSARAGTSTPFSFGKTITPDQGNFDGSFTYGGSSKGQYRQSTIESASFKPNAFGLHNMHGNVWEWVEDCYREIYTGLERALVESSRTSSVCSRHTLRGGGWNDRPRAIRSSNRDVGDVRDQANNLGFRVARSLD